MAAVGFLVSLLGLGVRTIRTLFFIWSFKFPEGNTRIALLQSERFVDLDQNFFLQSVYPNGWRH
ncbi:MAG TPA: hypothetical protein DIT50_08280 [Rhodocyclaceae bacterium]|nr:hypothetical protein [Rhodocyclaceae bacterium]